MYYFSVILACPPETQHFLASDPSLRVFWTFNDLQMTRYTFYIYIFRLISLIALYFKPLDANLVGIHTEVLAIRFPMNLGLFTRPIQAASVRKLN